MALIALLIGIVLIVAAVRNSQSDLFNALGTDVPKFAVWAGAIVAIGALGYVPGLKPSSRLLLGLIILVIVTNNYQNIIQGFTGAVQNAELTPVNPMASSTSGTTPLSSAPSGTSVSQSLLDSIGGGMVDGEGNFDPGDISSGDAGDIAQ